MLRLFITYLALLCSLGLPVKAQDRQSITVSGTELSGLLDARRAGPYNEIFHLLTDTYPAPVFLTIAPMRRATRFFVQQTADCLFVGSDNPQYYAGFGMKPEEILISKGIYKISIRIYSAKGSAPIESKEELFGKSIAMDTGVGNLSYVATLLDRHPNTILTAQTLEQGFQMLDIGRIVGLIAIDTDVAFLQLQEASFKGYPVSETFSVRSSDDVLACRKMVHTEPFMEHVNSKITELKSSGKIRQILTNSFLGKGGMGNPSR